MKKILALFLVLATVLSLMTVGAYAAADNALSVSCKLYDGYTVVTVQKSGTVYYTTDGSKPTSKSKKLNSTRIKVSEPCRVRLVSYVKGKPVEYLTKKIPVRLRKPTASLSSKGKEYTYVISIPDGASAYITYDGTTPSKSQRRPCAGRNDIGSREEEREARLRQEGLEEFKGNYCKSQGSRFG